MPRPHVSRHLKLIVWESSPLATREIFVLYSDVGGSQYVLPGAWEEPVVRDAVRRTWS